MIRVLHVVGGLSRGGTETTHCRSPRRTPAAGSFPPALGGGLQLRLPRPSGLPEPAGRRLPGHAAQEDRRKRDDGRGMLQKSQRGPEAVQ